MLVENTTKSIHVMDHADTVHGNTVFTHSARVMPGVNEVPDDVWALLMKNPVHALRVELGELRAMPAAGPADFDEPAACELVKHTYDRELLRRWAAAEQRKKVAEALRAQLEAVAVKAA